MGRATETIEPIDNLNWSTLPPTDPGFYWIAEADEKPHIVEIGIESDSHNMLYVLLPGDDKKCPLDMWSNALWCGPLEHPE